MNSSKSDSDSHLQSLSPVTKSGTFHSRRILPLCLTLLLLGLVGCSLAYDLHLEGELLAGPAKTPIAGATITLYSGTQDHVTCTTDQQGRWELTESISDSKFEYYKDDKDGNRIYRLRDDSNFSLRIRIITDGKTYIVPCPRVSTPESGGDIYAFVFTVLNVEPEEEVVEKDVEV